MSELIFIFNAESSLSNMRPIYVHPINYRCP